MTPRVVITGIGVVSPIGSTKETFWGACLAGRSGAVRLRSAWVSETGLSTRIAAPVRQFDPSLAGLESRRAGWLDRTALFALAAADQALRDAGFSLATHPAEAQERVHVREVDERRLASVIGSGIGGLASFERFHASWQATRSKQTIKRYALPMLIPNAPAAQIAIRFGARAECKSISTACAAGTMAVGDAWRLLRSGDADVVLAGGADGVVGDDDAFALMGFDRLRTLSTRNDEPARASRPFDLRRDGFVLGEGSAVLVLEREDHASARGARHYARVAGYATNCDARSMVQLDESGDSIVALIQAALRSAALVPTDIDHVSAHGTSTRTNDRTEAKALQAVFGRHCDDVAVTGLKSMTGHCIAGSGPMEIAAAALALESGMLPPTINYEYPDPDCDLDIVANSPRQRQAQACLKLSYGFGGHNACLVLTR